MEIARSSITVLIGNKLDLEKDRKVNAEYAAKEAEQRGCFHHFEVSAKNAENLHDLFQRIINMHMYTFPKDAVFRR